MNKEKIELILKEVKRNIDFQILHNTNGGYNTKDRWVVDILEALLED